MSGLPVGWAEATLAELLQEGLFSDGDWVETKDQDPSGSVRLIQLADIGDGSFRDRSARYLNAEAAKRLGCTYLEAGDVLIARMPGPLGRACLFPGVGQPSVTAVDVCILRPRSNSLEARWLMWAINSPSSRSQIAALQSGTTRKRISRKNLGSITLLVPPITEQERIVEVIDEQLSRLDVAEQLLASARSRLLTLRQRTVEVLLARAWPFVAFAALLREPLRNGHSSKKSDLGSGIRTLTLTAVTNGDFSERNTKLTSADPTRVKDLWLEPGDLLIERSNTPDLVGTTRMFRGPRNYAIFPDLVIRARVKPVILPEFAELVLQAEPSRRYFRSSARGIAGSMPKISQSTIERIEVPCPPMEEQRQVIADIGRQLSITDAMEATIEAALKRSAALRRAILDRAFRGALVPRHAREEPASARLERVAREGETQASKPRRRAAASRKP